MNARPFVALAFLAAAFAAAPAVAQQPEAVATPIILVVDIQAIQQESAAAKAMQKQLDAQREAYQKEIASQEERLRNADQELNKQRPLLSADAFAQKRRDFEQQVVEVQRNVQVRRRAYDQAAQEAMNQIRTAAFEIITNVAGERRANLVLPRQQVLLVEKGLDVTDIVMERLNKKLPTVKVTVPKS
ncbi:OmpH family outer membrane protein [Arenibaculum pallidiluteum]|uniref:OmpH family outer membrane protein n=1 Tax=Arenibaculum pallidiluteum TaxID=2812559 RepID=UPI001A97BC00|nr:OmpH family outer membrane protein [Arenibaculum pallidiluteum]